MGLLKSKASTKTVLSPTNNGNSFLVPDFPYLLEQTLSTAKQPNILCYDDNMFMKCSCNYEHQKGAAITNDIISRYFIAGLEHPIESLFSTSHSAKALVGVCQGIMAAATAASIPQVR